MALYETIVDFKNLKDNGFDLTGTLEFQGWNTLFERLTGPVYPVLIKQLWVHAVTEKVTITSYIMNRKIVVTKKSVTYLISHNGCGKKVYNVKFDAKRDTKVASTIFKEGTEFDNGKGPSAKDLTNNLTVWFKIIMGCTHYILNTNSFDYINITHKFMLLFLEKGIKVELPSILFRFLMDSIRETRIGSSSTKGKFNSNGRLIRHSSGECSC